jgi:GrpB-like predicted nucleotidyltransferase (UPF0157 family)
MTGRARESLEERIARVVKDRVEVVPYCADWSRLFEEEKTHLLSCLPPGIVRRIEHFGSTSVPGLAAKPVVDMLVEVSSLDETRRTASPILEDRGYDYFWRPTYGDDGPPWYAWFIRRDTKGVRTHHIHMVENTPEFAGHWERLLFRDYLRMHPETAAEYGALKLRLAREYPDDRVEYTRAKGEFIMRVTDLAKAEAKRLPIAPRRH